MRASLLWVYIGLAGCHRLFGLTGVESTGDTEPDARLERDGGRERDGGGEALVVFATSARLTGDMGGLSGADEACTSLASAAGLPGTFKAWLSNATESPASRMERGGPYVLVNGVTVATDWDDLTDGTINTPINVDERGNGVVGEWVCAYGELWSNTDAQGNTVGDACAGWTTTSGSSGNGGGARVASTDETWTSPVCPSVTCSAPLSIYCVQQP